MSLTHNHKFMGKKRSFLTENIKRHKKRANELLNRKIKPIYLSDYMMLNPEIVETIMNNLLGKSEWNDTSKSYNKID